MISLALVSSFLHKCLFLKSTPQAFCKVLARNFHVLMNKSGHLCGQRLPGILFLLSATVVVNRSLRGCGLWPDSAVLFLQLSFSSSAARPGSFLSSHSGCWASVRWRKSYFLLFASNLVPKKGLPLYFLCHSELLEWMALAVLVIAVSLHGGKPWVHGAKFRASQSETAFFFWTCLLL